MATYYTVSEEFEIDFEIESKIKSFFQDFSDGLVKTVLETKSKKVADLLDFSGRSIKTLDKVADEWIDSSEISDSFRFNLIRAIGGYICQTIDKNFHGHWVKNDDETLFIFYQGETQSSLAIPPYDFAVRRVDDGEMLQDQWDDLFPLIRKFSKLKST